MCPNTLLFSQCAGETRFPTTDRAPGARPAPAAHGLSPLDPRASARLRRAAEVAPPSLMRLASKNLQENVTLRLSSYLLAIDPSRTFSDPSAVNLAPNLCRPVFPTAL